MHTANELNANALQLMQVDASIGKLTTSKPRQPDKYLGCGKNSRQKLREIPAPHLAYFCFRVPLLQSPLVTIAPLGT
jgi:hypothetical protein